MLVLIDRLGLILFDATLSTAVFLSLMIVAMLVCRQPARRLLIARVAFCASLAMLPLIAFAPLPRLDLVQILTRSKIIPVSFREIAPPTRGDPLRSAAADLAHPWPIIHDLHATRWGNWLVRGLTLLDLAGIGTGSAWLILGLWGVHWLLRQSREPNAQIRALYERLQAGGSPILTKTDLRVSGHLRRPAVVGLFQPTILIPASFDADLGDLEQLRLSLLHEMAHIEQRDHWHGAVANLAQTAWFLLPQVWWLRSQLRIDQEFLADRFAASRFGSSSGYAASLLMLASRRPESRPSSRRRENVSVGPGTSRAEVRSPLFQRLLMLLHCPHRIETRAPRLWSWSLRVIVMPLLLFAACVCIRWPDAEAIEPRSSGLAVDRQPFRVADFVAEPHIFPPAQRALAYVMPVILPTRFDLKVQVLATRADLAHARIAGHLLGLPRWADSRPTRVDSESGERESWHQVRLVRDGQDLRLWFDDQAVPVTMKPEDTTESLTIEPGPERSLRFRNLVVEW
jgi:beta-lactamase regulating signal transducer with metallopeptidase domain